MKEAFLRMRLSKRRYDKVKFWAEQKDKTLTQVIEELIDTLPALPSGDSSSTPSSR